MSDLKKYRQEYKRKRAAEFLQQGLCRNCGKCPIYKNQRCEKCYKTMMTSLKTLRQKRKEQGLCIRCGKAPIFKSSLCEQHYQEALETHKRLYHKRIQKNLCANCGKAPIYRATLCKKCYINRHHGVEPKKRPKEQRKKLYVYISVTTSNFISDRAAELKTSKSALVEKIIEDYLKDIKE